MTTDTQKALPRLSRRRRWLIRLVGGPLILYLGVVAIFASFQAKLIFPGAATQGTPEAVVVPPADGELVTLTATSGDRVVALFGKALNADGSARADAATCPTMLYFYGNGMCLQAATEQFAAFRLLGINVMIPDYIGYGMSGGQPSEVGCRETAEVALRHLEARPDVDRLRIVAAGWSLGGAVAIDLAERHPVAGLVTFSTFTSLPEMARRLFPYLPTAHLLRYQFDSRTKIARVQCPIFNGHGRRDAVVPFTMADELAAAVTTSLTRITIDDADHNDFFAVGGDPLFTALGAFIAGLPGRRELAPTAH